MHSLKLLNGQEMPIIGLGTWNVTDPSELEKVLNAALELGYRHIDTAAVYNNEEIIGKVLKKWFSEGKLKREELFVTTKFSMMNSSVEKVQENAEISLKKLGLDYVDLYLIHFPVFMKFGADFKFAGGLPTDHLALWREFEKLVESGKTKAIGVSNFNQRQIKRILDSNPKVKPANNQIENHVYLQQQELVKFCQENGITVTAYSPLGSPGYNKFLTNIGRPTKELPDMLNDQTIQKIAKDHGKTSAQILLRYQIQRDIIVIPKTVTPSRAKENFDIFDFSLSSDEMKILDGLEVGEKARVCIIGGNGIEDHEEWPYPKQ